MTEKGVVASAAPGRCASFSDVAGPPAAAGRSGAAPTVDGTERAHLHLGEEGRGVRARVALVLLFCASGCVAHLGKNTTEGAMESFDKQVGAPPGQRPAEAIA